QKGVEPRTLKKTFPQPPAFRERSSNGFPTPLTRANPNDIIQGKNENLPVADLAFRTCPSPLDDGLDGGLNELLVHRDLELDLPDQVHLVLVTAVNLRMPLLPSQPLDVAHREAEYLHLAQRLLDSLKPRWLDNGNDVLHPILRNRVQADRAPPDVPPSPQGD